MPQRQDNAGAVCDSGMGMLFLTPFFRIFFGGGGAKIEFNFSPEFGIVELSLPLFFSLSWPLNSILVLSVA